MIGSHMVIMWENDNGSTTLSQRYAKAYLEPEPVDSPPWVATIVRPTEMTVRSTSVIFSMITNP